MTEKHESLALAEFSVASAEVPGARSSLVVVKTGTTGVGAQDPVALGLRSRGGTPREQPRGEAQRWLLRRG